MNFIKKYWGMFAGAVAVIFIFAFKGFASNKDMSANADSINSKIRATNEQIKAKGKSIENIHKEAEKNVVRQKRKNKDVAKKKKAVISETDIKRSGDLDGW